VPIDVARGRASTPPINPGVRATVAAVFWRHGSLTIENLAVLFVT